MTSTPPPTVAAGADNTSGGSPAVPPLLAMPLGQAIMKLAVPAMAGMFMISAFELVNAFWIGHLGAPAMAAFSTVTFVMWTLFSICETGNTGTNARVAQNTGAGDPAAARVAARSGIVLNTLLGVVFVGVAWAAQEKIIQLTELPTAVAEQVRAYYMPSTGSMLLLFPYMALAASFRGRGDTATPTIIIGGVTVLNGFLDPVFILGIGMSPWMGWGIAGAAYAALACRALGLLVLLLIAVRQGLLKREGQPWISGREMLEITRAGLPIAINGVFFSLTYLGIVRVLAPFGPGALAALGIGHRMEGIAWFTCAGFSVAAATLCGQAVGARLFLVGRRAVFRVATILSAVLVAVGLIFVVFAFPIAGIFHQAEGDLAGPQVIALGAWYLTIVGGLTVFLGLEVLFEESLGAASYSWPAMVIGLPVTMARIPLGYWLAHEAGMGPVGMWWAIALTTAIKGVALAAVFSRHMRRRALEPVPPSRPGDAPGAPSSLALNAP